jgi:hypothetical protein
MNYKLHIEFYVGLPQYQTVFLQELQPAQEPLTRFLKGIRSVYNTGTTNIITERDQSVHKHILSAAYLKIFSIAGHTFVC